MGDCYCIHHDGDTVPDDIAENFAQCNTPGADLQQDTGKDRREWLETVVSVSTGFCGKGPAASSTKAAAVGTNVQRTLGIDAQRHTLSMTQKHQLSDAVQADIRDELAQETGTALTGRSQQEVGDQERLTETALLALGGATLADIPPPLNNSTGEAEDETADGGGEEAADQEEEMDA